MLAPDEALDIDAQLADDLGRFFDDPLGFVMYAYEWDSDPALRVVELASPWNLVYDSQYGPDAWACEVLDEIGNQVRLHGFDGIKAVEAIRMAISSGHGIGKSALVAWIVDWIMSTRPHAKGVVTANTSDQLASKTWAEITKWTRRCITGHWFDITTGKGAMRMVHKQHPESWRVDAQTCREENSESFAGLHSASSTPFYIYDEASAIPDKIWEVSEGGLTDGEPMWFAFGNPTRNTGRFAECFGKFRHRWNTRQIDSRKVQLTNKQLLQSWVDDYGEDSDFVRVRVRGVFPRASSVQFIPRDLVDGAMARSAEQTQWLGRTAAVGVDVARFGSAQSVIRTRVGRDGKSIAPKRFRGLDTVQLASKVAEHIEEIKALGLEVVVFVDGGGVGGGVVDNLRRLNYDPIEVNFGSKAEDQRKYANKRAEMWGRAKAWLSIGCLQHDEQLATDLTAVEYGFNKDDQIQLERKEDMEKRGLASPDDGDALALTFAHPVPEHGLPAGRGALTPGAAREHDPYANLRLRPDHVRARHPAGRCGLGQHGLHRLQRREGPPSAGPRELERAQGCERDRPAGRGGHEPREREDARHCGRAGVQPARRHGWPGQHDADRPGRYRPVAAHARQEHAARRLTRGRCPAAAHEPAYPLGRAEDRARLVVRPLAGDQRLPAAPLGALLRAGPQPRRATPQQHL